MKKCADIIKKTSFARGHLKATAQVSYMTNPRQEHWRLRPNRNCLEPCTWSIQKLRKWVWAPVVSGFLVEFFSVLSTADIVPRNESTLRFGPSTFLLHERMCYISDHSWLFRVVPQLSISISSSRIILLWSHIYETSYSPYKFRCSSSITPVLAFTLKLLVQPA